jgi:hypothetical protein
MALDRTKLNRGLSPPTLKGVRIPLPWRRLFSHPSHGLIGLPRNQPLFLGCLSPRNGTVTISLSAS